MTNKFLEIQKRIKVPKQQHNDFKNFDYRSCEDILRVLKPVLAELNCVLVLDDRLEHFSDNAFICATATIQDCETNASVTSHGLAKIPTPRNGMDESQATGSASSYARKYALAGLLLLDSGKDPDSLEPLQPYTPQPTKPQPKNELKGGESTKAEIEEIKNLLSSSYVNGMPVFTDEEKKRYSEDRKTLYTAKELITTIKNDLYARLQGF